MKKLIYLLLLPLALAVAACGGKNGSSNKESVLARQDSVDAHGLQRMQSSKAETDIKFKGRDYHSLVSRTPDESLPHVSNEMGDTYVDILEGIVYDKTTPEGIVYAASVCYPQTDLYVPLSITVTADGKMSIKKVDMLEDDYTEETPE